MVLAGDHDDRSDRGKRPESPKVRRRRRSAWKRSGLVAAPRPARHRGARRPSSSWARVSQTRRLGPGARQEVGTCEPSRGPLASASGSRRSSVRSRPGLAKAGPRTGRIATRRGYTYRHASSADLVIEVPGVPHANRGALGGIANPRTTFRAARDAAEVGALERATTQPDGRPIRPLGSERLDRDQARGSCETELLNQARPSSSHRSRRPPGPWAHRRKTMSSQPRSGQRVRGARPVVGSPSRRGAEQS